MKHTFLSVSTALILVGVFAVAFITGLGNLAQDNGAVLLDTQTQSDLGNLTSSLSTYKSTVDSGDNSLTNSSISSGGDNSQNIVLDSLRGIPSNLKRTPVAIYSSTIGLAKRYLFGDSGAGVILDVFAGLLGLVLIVAFVRWLVTGQGGND